MHIWSNRNHSSGYLRSKTWGCKDFCIRNSKIVAKTRFSYVYIFATTCTIFIYVSTIRLENYEDYKNYINLKMWLIYRGGLWRLLPGVHVHIQGLRGGHPRPGLDGGPQECWRGLREERGKLKGLYRGVFRGVVPMNQWILRALDPNNGCWATFNPPWKAKS